LTREPSSVAPGNPGASLTAKQVFAGYAGTKGRSGVAGDVLSDVNLTLSAGELVVVIGPNGAGKSTLLRVLAGTLPPRLGHVSLLGRDLARLDRRTVAQQLAVVPETGEVALGFRVEQVVMMGRTPHQSGLQLASAADVAAVEEAMAMTGTEHLRGRPVSELSGGEQKLVALARALAQTPTVLLLDEPSARLDPHHAVALFEMIIGQARSRGLACLAIAHDLNLAAAFADRVVLLSNGTVRASGGVGEVMTEEHLHQTFGPNLRIGELGQSRFFVPRRKSERPDTRPPTGGDL
jgi:iron complex transport system ATP-binding protein